MATTWSATDKQQVTLSNGNLTSTATAGGFSSGRTNVSWAAGKVYLEIVLGGPPSPFSADFSAEFGSGGTSTPISNNTLVGIANASWNLFNQLGQANPSNSVGIAVGNIDEVYTNNIFISGGTHPCAVGDTVSMAADYNNKLFWYTTDQMQVDIGAGAWNSSLSANPATSVGGVDFSGVGPGPFFGAWDDSDTVGNSVTINAHAPWHRAIPAGFSPADSGVVGTISAIQAPQTTIPGTNPFSSEFSTEFGWGEAFTGVVIVGGVIATTQAPQTMSGAGTATLPARTGVISATQAPQTFSGTGIVSAGASSFGPIVATQAAQTMVATGTVTTVSRIGVISVTEAPDTMAASGFVGIMVGIPFVEWMT